MVSEKHKRLQRHQRKRRIRKYLPDETPAAEPQRKGFEKFYHTNYRSLLWITTALLLTAIGFITFTFFTTGDVIHKGVSLSGGLTITIPADDSPLETTVLRDHLMASFPRADFSVREVSELGRQVAIVIEGAPPASEDLAVFENAVLDSLASFVPDIRETASTEVIGSSLGQSFFKQIVKAVLIALAFMGMVVFVYFGETRSQKALVVLLTLIEGLLIWFAAGFTTILAILVGIVLIAMYVRFSVPSAAVILAAISTIITTIAVVDILELRISTAGIAAFLMLIGYSVDTDILLSMRLLKQGSGDIQERVKNAAKTGLTMQGTTLAAALVALIFTQSDVIREIMTIIFIGLIADVLFTWIQNAAILRMFIEKRGTHGKA